LTETPNEIREKGFEALLKALGPIGMLRFLEQFDTGKGDYTKERSQWLDQMSIEDIVEDLKGKKEKS
jgi:predicted transcriptional regulator